jgi:hypothetical protein
MMANVDRSGKDPSRVEAGKKAAETRGHESLSEAGKKGTQSLSHEQRVEAGKKAAETRGHESLSEAGRKGGEHSRGGKS